MDRRQRKTRTAIFSAFITLLAQKEYSTISVQEIIDEADVGRATFYAHFETKDFLLKSLCEELFEHVTLSALGESDCNIHYKDCNETGDMFLHLIRHLANNDNHILKLLVSPNNELFLRYFKDALSKSVRIKNTTDIPNDFLKDHIASTFVETILWWVKRGKKESPETVAKYLSYALGNLNLCFTKER